MKVYHGSNRNFKKLKIAKSLVNYQSTLENEGMGIYFSTDRKIAESYGKYVYVLELNDIFFTDFRKKGNCRKYVEGIRKYVKEKTGVNIADYIDINSLIEYMYFGGISISRTGHEIYMLLDSNADFYQLPKTKIDKIYQLLRTYDKNHLTSYMFNYNIKNIGVIKNVDEKYVKIIEKQPAFLETE